MMFTGKLVYTLTESTISLITVTNATRARVVLDSGILQELAVC